MMSNEMTYLLMTPYTLMKSRTGGILSRLLSRVELELVAAQVITPDQKTVELYAESVLAFANPKDNKGAKLLHEYILTNMSPSEGRPHRIALFLFKGENAITQVMDNVGALLPENLSFESLTGETIRDTYADLILDSDGNVKHFEPAVLSPRSKESALANIKIFASFMKGQNNVVHNIKYTYPEKIQKTLVIIKPDNWKYKSTRPGSIIDMFSRSGLRITGLKVYRMSVTEAMAFYTQVKSALEKKYAPIVAQESIVVLEKQFSIKMSDESRQDLGNIFSKSYAEYQYHRIIEFMSGQAPEDVQPDEMNKPGSVQSMIIVYEGENAIEKIRTVLGPTDPRSAPGGTVRRDFGSDIMVNAVHASDSPESAEREGQIVKINENDFVKIYEEYCS